jgi:hypothetical protein
MKNDSQKYHIRDVCTAANNPQSNAICKKIHTIGNILRTNIWGHIAKHVQNIWGQIADTKEYTWNIIDYHTWHESRHTLNFRQQPRQSYLQQRQVSQHTLIADWHAVFQKREHLFHENLIQNKQKWRWYNYHLEQGVLKKRWKLRKLDARTSGPYRVLQTQVNGTVTIVLRPGVSERLNISRVNRTKNEC